jgi:hypothetical protein
MSDIPKSVKEAFKKALRDVNLPRVTQFLEADHVTATTPLTTWGNHETTPLSLTLGGRGNDDNCAKIAEMLLLRGADPNSGTPLVSASLHGLIKTAGILLEFGADTDAKNTDGMTASMAPHWGSPYSRRYAGAINDLLKHPPKLRETTHVAVPPPEDPLYLEKKLDIETMGSGAAAVAVVVSSETTDALASSDDKSTDSSSDDEVE